MTSLRRVWQADLNAQAASGVARADSPTVQCCCSRRNGQTQATTSSRCFTRCR